MLNYLTYRYNYDRKFQGAKYDEKDNPTNKAAELRQKFEGQKQEDVIDGLFENWKLDNPTLINDNIVKRFKQIIYMLLNYTYSKYAINKGYNDDVKLLSPYYFELISSPNPKENRYWEFEHCKVKLNSSYFNFSGWIGPPPEPINYWKEVEESDKSFIIDSKYYIVVARNSLNSDWKIFKLKNNGEKGSGLKTDWCERPVGWIFTSNGIYLATGNLLDTSMEYVWGKNKKYESYIKSVYRWDAIDEPNTPFISPKTEQITDWNLKQQLNVNNNKDNKIKVSFKNKDISENPIYQLEANYFNWLSITNEL
ncbi:hypothetical protein [Spiroplasma endosymbiont of Ammophila pubescens]|uniref:hypothetical protein n=1 Tax=Spiroplasma endosymbiont of Ammophila pubescens TaxID=3066315 RepID=UPI0032B2D439